jgi:hypothetical protein
MTATRRSPLLVRAGSAAVLVLALAGCTPGGQFDPTTLLANDTFDTKTKLKGDRQPVFPNGVPGTSSGVPQDLVKGYQPPPDQAADANAPDAAAEEAAKNKPKPKPKPKVARAPATPPHDAAWDQKPASSAPQMQQPAQANWPAPQPTGQAQQATPGQTNWPAPPPAGQAQQAVPPAQSIWPNPPAPGTYSR